MDFFYTIIEYTVRRLKLLLLRLKFLYRKILSTEKFVKFRCNICGKICRSPQDAVQNRELTSCYHCGSNRRFRSIAAALTTELFGRIITLCKLQSQKNICGIGMSDALIYGGILQKKFTYQNTFYHKTPRLDITSIDAGQHNSYDFIITSDVFEHIPPPVENAFANLYDLLKNRGVCIFSVPYHNSGKTQEHYPQLYDYQIIKEMGRFVLKNTTRTGEQQSFDKLRFHGGPGATLEMRFFSKADLHDNLKNAGFSDIRFHDNSIPEFGILIEKNALSLIISMRKKQA